MFQSRNALHGSDKFQPGAALLFQNLAPGGGQLVITAAALALLFHPASQDPSALLQPVEKRIKGGDVERQCALRLAVNELADLVTVTRPGFQQREDEQLSAAFLEFA